VSVRDGVSLMLVTDRRRLGSRSLPALAREAAEAGVDYVQLREKDLGSRALVALAREVVAAVAGTPCAVLVNGRPDVAELVRARGVQLPERGLPVAEVRRAFPRLLVGASCHSVEAAVRAEADGADLVVMGPVFATPGKDERLLGLQPLAAAARALRVPVHAIGGIDPSTAGRAVSAGARGLAAIRAFAAGPVQVAAAALRAGASTRA
jgi:thiamine-phosphate pyrophosphorylase